MPEKDGDEGKSTKSVVNKKQKQMMGEEGYDIARDQGRVRPSKDKKDATTLRKPPSKEMKKTQKVNKGPSALDIVKKKYKGQIMKVEELDLTKVAEAFGGYIVEANGKNKDNKPVGQGNVPFEFDTFKKDTETPPNPQPDVKKQYTKTMRKNVKSGKDVLKNIRKKLEFPTYQDLMDRQGVNTEPNPDQVYMTKDGKFTRTRPPQTDDEVIPNQKPSGFIGDTPPSREKITPPDRKKKVTQSKSDALRGDTVTYGQPDQVKPKQGRLSKIATAAAANPAAALVAYDLGKGIIGKISKLRAPAVVGGKAGFRSAGGYQAT